MKKNIVISGPMNSGKTENKIKPLVKELIKENKSFLVLDAKEEYLEYKEQLENQGYNVHILDLRNPANSNASFNPLIKPYELYKSGNIDAAIEMLQSITNAIFVSGRKTTEEFWDNSAASFMNAMTLLFFKEESDMKNITIANVYKHTMELSKEKSVAMIEMFEKLDALDPIYIFGSATVFAPAETKGGIISNFQSKIDMFIAKPNLNKLISNSRIPLDEKTAIFLINKDEGGVENVFARVIINQIADEVFNKKTPFTFILDNYDSIVIPEYLYNYFCAAPARGIYFVLATRADIMKNNSNEQVFNCFEQK